MRAGVKAEKELERLFQQAEQCALASMKEEGRLQPLLLVATPSGELRYTAPIFDDRKDMFVNTCRMICAASQATAVVLATEAWLKMAEPGDESGSKMPPSECSDRIEVVILMGEAVGVKNRQKWMPIVRSDRGDFFGFGESEGPKEVTLEGRFSQFLPPKPPSAADRMLTTAVLAAMGISLDGLRPGPDRN